MKHIFYRLYALLLSLICVATAATANNVVTLDSVSAQAGEKIQMSISLSNTDAITAFQMDLLLPEGFDIAEDESGNSCLSLSNRTDNTKHTLSIKKIGECYKIVAISFSKAIFTGSEGCILELQVQVPKDIEPGTFTAKIQNIVLSTSASNKLKVPDAVGLITIEDYSTIENYFIAPNINLNEDKEADLIVSMNNVAAISEFSFVLTLPNGITIKEDEDGYVYEWVSSRINTRKPHELVVSQLTGNSYQISASSTNNLSFKGNSGELFSITLVSNKDIIDEQEYTLSNIKLIGADATVYKCPNIKSYFVASKGLTGDVNKDGRVDISDVNAVITVICGGTIAGSADVNGDTNVDISDVNAVISIICGN